MEFPPASSDEPILYANVARVWHTPFEFTLDFGVAGAPQDATDGLVVPVARVTSVKIPTSVIFTLARAIAENVDAFENTYGPIGGTGGPSFQQPS
ncbi:MAG: hypothetical protein JWM12_2558 [Ilumatobacteraceae bacterium]|nr:hypothetical protein [Ilumatobacteraceae bacterium]